MLLNEIFNPDVFQRGFETQAQHGRYHLTARHGQLPWLGHGREAIDVVVNAKHRRRGLATAMYRLARDLGNDIRPSSKQTGMGREFWRSKSTVDEEQLDELSFLGSQCTKDCSGHRAGYDWCKRKGRTPQSWSPSFNKGAALAQSGK